MPQIERFVPQVKAQPWGTETLVAKTAQYTGKVLDRVKTGQRAGLQIHPNRSETFYVFSGVADVYYDRGDGVIIREQISSGQSIHVPAGVAHSVETITRTVMFEASIPDDTPSVPVEAQYADQMRALGASISVQG